MKSHEDFTYGAVQFLGSISTHHPRIRLLFQPAYHPWVNVIERHWNAMHDTITRNHRYTTIDRLMKAVRRFLKVAQLFPGNQHALARA